MMEEQENRIDFDLQKIKQELNYENINISDDIIQIQDACIFKQYNQNDKDKLYLKQYYGIFVEQNSVEELNNNNNNIVENSKIIEEQPEIFNEHTLEVKQQWRTTEYIYKKSTQLLFDLNQWKIYILYQQDGMHHIFRLFSKIFQIINHLWYNHSQYQINLDLNNFAIDSDNKIIIFNQSDIQDKKQNMNEKEKDYIYEFGNLMCEILKDINNFKKEWTSQETAIINCCCELLQQIFQNKIQNLNQIRIIFYEIITKTFFSYIIIKDKVYAESLEIYKKQFEIFKNKNKEFTLPKYYKYRDLEFDFKQANNVETECINNIKQNKDTLKNYLILSYIYIRYKRNFLQSVEYLNKAIQLDPYDIDILIAFMIIFIQFRSVKIYSPIRFSLICLSNLFEDYWQIYYLVSWLYDRDFIVDGSREYMAKTYKLNNTDPQILSLDAIIHLSQKQNEISQNLIDKALAANKMNYPIVYFRKGFILDDINIDGSLEWYYKSLEVDPQAADIYFNIGFYYCEKDNIEKSIEFYNKCIEIDPYYVNAYLNQESNYNNLHDKIKQKQCLEKAIEVDPNNFKAYLNLGVCLELEDKFDEAIKLWKKSIALNPTYPDAYGLIAYRLYAQSETESSIYYYKKYYMLSNNYENESTFSLSVLHQINNDFESSEIYALQLIKERNTNGDINLVLNSLCEQNLDEDGEHINNQQYDEIYDFVDINDADVSDDDEDDGDINYAVDVD